MVEWSIHVLSLHVISICGMYLCLPIQSYIAAVLDYIYNMAEGYREVFVMYTDYMLTNVLHDACMCRIFASVN